MGDFQDMQRDLAMAQKLRRRKLVKEFVFEVICWAGLIGAFASIVWWLI